MVFDLGIKAELSLEWNSSQGWLKGNISQPGSECVDVEVHTLTHTCIHPQMRFHPPDLAALFPSSGIQGISFLAMCCFLASERLYSFLLKETVMGKCLHLNVSFFLFPSPPSFSLVFLSLSICSLSWHLLSGRLIILFFRFLIRILSLPLCLCPCPCLFFLSSSYPSPGPPPQTTPIMFSLLLFLSLFMFFLCRIQFSII